MFFNLNALITVIVTLIFSMILHKNDLRAKLDLIVNFNELLIWVISLGYLVMQLSQLSDSSKLGEFLSFFILSNLYSGVLNILVKIYHKVAIKE